MNFRTELEHLRQAIVAEPANALAALSRLRDAVRETISAAEDELARLNGERIEIDRQITTMEQTRPSVPVLPHMAEDGSVLALLQTLQPETVTRWLAEEERLLAAGSNPAELLRGLAMFVALARQITADPELLEALSALPLGDSAWRAELTATLPLECELRRRVLERGVISSTS